MPEVDTSSYEGVGPQFGGPAEPSRKGPRGLKIAVLVAFLLSLLSLAAVALLYRTLNSERREFSAAEAEIIQLQTQVDSLQAKVSKYENEAAELRDQIKSLKAQGGQLEKELDAKEVEISNLQKNLKILSEAPGGLPKPISEAPAQTAPSGVAMEAVTVTEAEIKPETVVVGEPLPTTEVAAPTQPAAPTGMPKVMTINRKFNFVVFNLGTQDQMKMGETLQVVRDGKVIAKVQIEKLYERFAAATIIEESPQNLIKEGDQIQRPQ